MQTCLKGWSVVKFGFYERKHLLMSITIEPNHFISPPAHFR